jgi:glycosyltransferase involved in cell wall biosynthesis
MRIMVGCNAVWDTTGYGTQGRLIMRALRELGHDVAQFVTHGLRGGVIEFEGLTMYPPHVSLWGEDILPRHLEHFGADLYLSFMDLFVLPAGYRRMLGRPWAALTPIDATPPHKRTVEMAREADWTISGSVWGQREMQRVGVPCEYVPHCVDIDLFRPMDRAEARRALGWDQGALMVGMVAANKGFPSRKGFPEGLQAFAQFAARHPEAQLYLHTNLMPWRENAGINVLDCLRSLGLDSRRVSHVDQYAQAVGLPDEHMRAVYSGLDVLLMPSMAEGFGLPAIEAQACGCPVIGTDFSSLTELIENGIRVFPAQVAWSQQSSWQAVPSVSGTAAALETWLTWSDSDRDAARNRGIANVWNKYAYGRVRDEHWRPLLDRIEGALGSGSGSGSGQEVASGVYEIDPADYGG